METIENKKEDSYCALCGNTGELFSGERCTCSKGQLSEFENDSVCLSVPEQYRGVQFNSLLLPPSLGEGYANYMDKLHKDIVTQKFRNKNVFLSSPAKSGKTVLAYSAIQALFRRGLSVFPVFDVLEIRKIMNDMDMGKKLPELEELEIDGRALYASPYLFVKITTDYSYAVFDTISILLSRRLRYNGDTILLSDMGWSYVAEADSKMKGVFGNLLGDGSFGTIDNHTYFFRKDDVI